MGSALTNKEREGLEDVFLSINSGAKKYEKLKNISAMILGDSKAFSLKNLFKHVRMGVKESKFSHFLTVLDKKKKNLSK